MSSVCKCVHVRVCARPCLSMCIRACLCVCVRLSICGCFSVTLHWLPEQLATCAKSVRICCALLYMLSPWQAPLPSRISLPSPLSYASALKAAVVTKASQTKRDLLPASVAVVVRLTKHHQGREKDEEYIEKEWAREKERKREGEQVCSRGGGAAVWVGERLLPHRLHSCLLLCALCCWQLTSSSFTCFCYCCCCS